MAGVPIRGRAYGRRKFIGGTAAVAGAAALSGWAAERSSAAPAWEDVINASFENYKTFDAAWNYLYPWGSDHNGTARMYGNAPSGVTPRNAYYVYLISGVLTLQSTRISKDEGKSSAPPHLPIHYRSGAVHAKKQIVVTDEFPEYEVKGEFQAPSSPGTWPAFWLSGAQSWPPESDILEFKGENTNWFNTFRTAEDVSTTTVDVPSPGDWHTYRAWITKLNSTEVEIHYYLDGIFEATHRADFVGKPLWLIMNLQMEGSSGSAGPDGATNNYFRARNVYVGRKRA